MTTLNENLLQHAFDGVSFNPEKRAQSVRSEFAAYMEQYRAAVAGLENEAELIDSFQAGLAKRMNDWLTAKSRCISWAVTGPARFPVRKADAANNREMEKSRDLYEWIAYRMRKAQAAQDKKNGKGPILASESDAPQQLKTKIAHLQALHELEITYNKARRKGLETAKEWLLANIPQQPDNIKAEFQKRFKFYDAQEPGGFPSYHFQLENANIKRLKGRLETIEKKRAAAENAEPIETAAGVRIEKDAEANRIRLYYPEKPSPEEREKLKKNGFRWSPKNAAWQAFFNRSAEIFIQKEFLQE